MEEGRRIRKSAYGRTKLFLPSETDILREVKCMGGITRHDVANLFHLLPVLHASSPSSSPLSCWHCCEPIADRRSIVPMPRSYDAAERTYHVYGAACGPGCAKAYIMEHTTFDRGQHLNTLTKMLRDVYGITEPVVETPPRPALARFGGPFHPSPPPTTECRIVEPPFVSYCMLIEERAPPRAAAPRAPAAAALHKEEPDTFEEPPPPALFDDFVASVESGAVSLEPERPPPRKRPQPAPSQRGSAPSGPLAKFVKK